MAQRRAHVQLRWGEEWGGERGSRRPRRLRPHGLEEFAPDARTKKSPSGPRKVVAPSRAGAEFLAASTRPRPPPPAAEASRGAPRGAGRALAPTSGRGAGPGGMPGIGKETGDKAWDPYGFSLKRPRRRWAGFARPDKHGRVAMLAFKGFCVQGGPRDIPRRRAPRRFREALRGAGPGAGGGHRADRHGDRPDRPRSESVKPHTQGGSPATCPSSRRRLATAASTCGRRTRAQERASGDDGVGLLRGGGRAGLGALWARTRRPGAFFGGWAAGTVPAAPIVVLSAGKSRRFASCALGRAVGGGLVLGLRQPRARPTTPSTSVAPAARPAVARAAPCASGSVKGVPASGAPSTSSAAPGAQGARSRSGIARASRPVAIKLWRPSIPPPATAPAR